MSSLQESEIVSLQLISTRKDDFIHLNIDKYETLDVEVQLSTASVSNETIGGDYTGGTEQAMDEVIVDESCEIVESGYGLDLYAQFISATGVTYNDLLESLLSKDRKTKVTMDNFLQYFEPVNRLSAGLTKDEILICLDRIKLQNQQMYFAKSWNKQKLAQYLYNCLTDQSNLSGAETNRKRGTKSKNPTKLSAMCKKIIRKFPKWLLNIIVSEYEFMPEYDNWKIDLPFTNPTKIVIDAEDKPGLTSAERCESRLQLREWLLEDVNFSSFQPYGSHIRWIPLVMFQGFLTNIDRRIKIVPYIKSRTYNVRALGSLEVENFFGQFQDLDHKGSGVIKAEEVPAALESACQLLKTCMRKDRKFDMVISRKTKVYPIHEMMEECSIESRPVFMTPLHTDMITLKDHVFDNILRAKRKSRRRLVAIATPDEAARGVAPVRQHHKCDESKILPHKRLGLDLQ
ncbi:unnamed protein product [Mytilus coruscus]|uniref:EF-hand domain-containing protein n=1 Tax=Mytilus coruscus TaxID=42192 RepID=A0A6J8ERW7_MYTCO|nr:unnamed protein product [Mytilus coruscus]